MVAAALAEARTQDGEPLLELTRRQPVLLIFLRHFGCALCREMVATVAAHRGRIESSGVRVAFVHMHSEPAAARYFASYGLADVARVADGEHRLYDAFALARVGASHWFDWTVIARYIDAIFRKGHRPGYVGGDVLRLPGAFIVRDGRISKAFRPARVTDQVDLLEFVA